MLRSAMPVLRGNVHMHVVLSQDVLYGLQQQGAGMGESVNVSNRLEIVCIREKKARGGGDDRD